MKAKLGGIRIKSVKVTKVEFDNKESKKNGVNYENKDKNSKVG